MGAEYTCFAEKERERYAIKCDNDIEGLNKGVGYGGEYCYIADLDGNPSFEKSITLVIPTSHNKELWIRYPEYLEKIKNRSEECNRDFEQRGEFARISPLSAAQNIIIVIGSFDAETINSMKVVLGDYELPDVEYALEYFRLHS